MKKYISIILFTLIIAGSSCKKDFLSLEANPNTPSVASPELLLSGALKTTAALTNSNAYVMYAGWIGYLSYSTGFQVNTALEQYIISSGTYDLWTNYYLNLSNYNALVKANPGPNYVAIGKIMTAFDFEALVDNYNNVPYSQALQGAANLTPAFDTGSAIYADLMKQLDAAIATIQTTTNLTTGAALGSAVVPGAGDIMFKGNMVSWVKFANTLKLRLALRQSTQSAIAAQYATAKAAVAATAALGYLGDTATPNGAVVNPGYLNSDASGGQQSPMYLSYGTSSSGTALGSNTTYQANAYAAHFYGSNNDPRLSAVYSISTTANAGLATSPQNADIETYGIPNNGAVVASPFGSGTPPNGIVAGANRGNLSPSKFGPGVLKSPTQNANILSAAEALFLQSEGVVRGVITGDAAALYKAGIEASFVDDALTKAQADTYLAQSQIAFPASATAQIKSIIVQKWAALNLYGAAEAFHEFQRTGYPDDIPLSIDPGASTAPNNVRRIPYPFVAFSTNATNVALQPAVNVFTSKIFWAL